MGCSPDEVAAGADTSVENLERACKATHAKTAAEYVRWKARKGAAALRRAQFKSADAGDSRMQVWLADRLLGSGAPGAVPDDVRSEIDALFQAAVRQAARDLASKG